jgi:hypothetical protein
MEEDVWLPSAHVRHDAFEPLHSSGAFSFNFSLFSSD